ncbi:hypothetical protein QQ045_020759 [Rhodiola kirilowii]
MFEALLLQCRVALQRYYALDDGRSLKSQTFDVSVSLTRTGIPRIIPRLLRAKIRRRDERSSSRALFSLSHHVIVWLAATVAYPSRSRPFWDYALLGDDIVIADRKVADAYQSILADLGVSISVPKSIVSDKGILEFAKKYWRVKPWVDLSPVSMKSLMTVQSSIALVALGHKYQLPLKQVLRLGGQGTG